MKASAAVGIAILLGIGAASGQISDPEQRMRWFDLQRLATEALELDRCQFYELKEGTNKFLSAHYLTADEMTAAIDSYVSKYPTRARGESTNAFRYRVWAIAIRVSLEKARPIRDVLRPCAAYWRGASDPPSQPIHVRVTDRICPSKLRVFGSRRGRRSEISGPSRSETILSAPTLLEAA